MNYYPRTGTWYMPMQCLEQTKVPKAWRGPRPQPGACLAPVVIITERASMNQCIWRQMQRQGSHSCLGVAELTRAHLKTCTKLAPLFHTPLAADAHQGPTKSQRFNQLEGTAAARIDP